MEGFNYFLPCASSPFVIYYQKDSELAGFVLASSYKEAEKIVKEHFKKIKNYWIKEIQKILPHTNSNRDHKASLWTWP